MGKELDMSKGFLPVLEECHKQEELAKEAERLDKIYKNAIRDVKIFLDNHPEIANAK